MLQAARAIMLSVLTFSLLLAGSGCQHDREASTPVLLTLSEEVDFDANSAKSVGCRPLVRIVAIGDSITAGMGSHSGGYPAMLQRQLQRAGYNVQITNAGVPGERSPYTNARFIRTIQGQQVVLLMIGTNDIVASNQCPYGGCRTLEQIATMLNKALTAGVMPIVSTIIPAHTADIYSNYNDEIQRLNAQILDLCISKHVRRIDNFSVIAQNGWNALLSDRLHPNDQGYELMANEWYEPLEKRLHPSFR